MFEKVLFKDRALVRKDEILYYGNLKDNYMLRLKILDAISLGDIKISSKVRAELLDTSDKKNYKIIKTTEREGLYEALEIGEIWISRMLSEEK